ncbi:MAG: alpha/beta fold hydrolase [Lactimicrobium sp.]|jgi:dienelactone hydrolase|uniref:alpha/beta hydrolase n=1 Tax=Lactimicrobium sp. TaxID=2563780 RepID=UPI002F35BEAD
MKTWIKRTLIITSTAAAAVSAFTAVSLIHYVGIPQSVSNKKTSYTIKTQRVDYDDISLYGKILIPEGKGRFPTVIYAHGAESDYKADMTTLKSLAESGIACYTFDFYGWTKRSTGPEDTHWFHDIPRGVDDSYQKKVLQQVEDLNAVIDTVKTWNFVDTSHLYLLGSSMGGATASAAAITHSTDVHGIILQYPAINLNPDALKTGAPLDVNGYTGPVLILQGTKDKIVPLEMARSLTDHYNIKKANHAKLIIYKGQPHVFTGKYKVKAAKDIYAFMQENS